MKAIKVTIKNVYGNQTIYPACETSALLATLSGHKTLTREAVKIIRALGYEIEVLTDGLDF